MKSTIGFIIFVLVTVGLLFSISGKRYPRIPDDIIHRNVQLNSTAPCMECHGAGRNAALKETHPPKFECFKCHKSRRVRRS
ncbi:MAG: hypothetical protein ABSB95_15655 [Dissulfurispiraceae bacterium]